MKDGEKKVYCINCGVKESYSVKKSEVSLTVRGVVFSYIEYSAYCSVCGEEIYVPELNDLNAQHRDNAYRSAANIISVDKINEILKKYNIGARPLALVLGVGEITIERYLKGQLPSKDISDKLLEVKSSYKIMEKYLEENKEYITPTAYKKCKDEINKLSVLYSDNKIEVVARYIIRKSLDITPLALQKLLYYVQAFYYAIYNKVLFSDECQAWVYGPVFPHIYSEYKNYGYNSIDLPALEDEKIDNKLFEDEIDVIDSVIKSFGKYSGKVLSEITHKERPWKKVRGPLGQNDKCEEIIPRDTIEEYFDMVVKKYHITNPNDIKRYCKDMVSKI